jgi:hypothetical protein
MPMKEMRAYMRCMPMREMHACKGCMAVRDAYLQEMHACEIRMTSFPPFKAILDGGAGEVGADDVATH